MPKLEINQEKNSSVLEKNKQLSSETMNAYFVAQASDVEFPLIGYYVGMYLAYISVKNGVNFEQFVSMPRNEIIDMWFKKRK